ncbi:hypothetical protein [Morganella morganii]|uniref:hypothetical protein n=1 Tax=Morganella morganii TaxID=582 RepID=UPI003D7F913C
MKPITLCKDKTLESIFNYRPIPFSENGSDNGFIIRVIELFKFSKMKPQLNQLEELTGFSFDNIEPSPEEIICLVNKGKALTEVQAKVLHDAKAELEKFAGQQAAIEQGSVKKPLDYRGTMRSWVEDVRNRVQRAESKVSHETELLQHISGLFSLLKKVTDSIDKTKLKEVNKKSLSEIPGTAADFFRLKTSNSWIKTPYEFITGEINVLTACINNVIGNCTPSNDKYAIHRGDNKKILHYKNYYAEHDKEIRSLFTADEYAQGMTEIENRIASKTRYMA